MDNSAEYRIKKYLEDTYDIPFDVSGGTNYGDAWFRIKPHNSGKELFEIVIKFKNKIRITIEVVPEEYAAFSIKDMETASTEKKQIFAEFVKQLIKRKATIDFTINGASCNATNPDCWPLVWNSYSLRITRSPICKEYETIDEEKITISWVTIITGMMLSLLNVIKNDDTDHYEGGSNIIKTNRYERNPINRELCLAANGYTCKICGLRFEKKYGEIGHNYIHVHHIIPISAYKEKYCIDPENDLIPVCPNCHAMLHRQDPPFSPEELRQMLENESE